MDGTIRLRRPDRDQTLLQPCHLEGLLPSDHDARMIWSAVERLDLSDFYAPIAARGEDPGRPSTDPALLVALWLYAAKEGVGSGRELARLCGCHDAYRWLCGGVAVNYHTLNDFRVGHERALDELFTRLLATLVHHDVVKVSGISQDGMRVRASAGKKSFRRRETLQTLTQEMRAHIRRLKQQADKTNESSAQARQRAAEVKLERIQQALSALDDMEAAKGKQKDKASKHRAARASTTDSDARVMRMPGGGFAPAYNLQLATDVQSRAIVGVAVTNANESEPMRRQVQRRTQGNVRSHLMDGGFVKLESIERAERAGVKVYAPVPESKGSGSRYAARPGDGPGVRRWRRRMRVPAAQKIYRRRAATSETVNADLRTHRGLDRLLVRGLCKVRCVTLWAALAYNLMHFGQYLIE